MKTGAIVIPLLNKFNEVLTGFGYQISMYQDIPIAHIGLHLYKPFEFLFLDLFVDFLADLVLFEVSKRGGGFIRWSKTGTGETCSTHVGLSLMLVHLILHAPLDEPFNILSCFQLFLDFLFLFHFLLFLLLF